VNAILGSRANLSSLPINTAINDQIEAAQKPQTNDRHYLGASVIGHECLRQIQFNWMVDEVEFPSRVRDIFARGHWAEAQTRQRLKGIGFKFAPIERTGFKAANGLFRGHCDGVLTAGPEIPGLKYPAIWEHKCLRASSWRAIEREGLSVEFAHYEAQVSIYQGYLGLPNDALYSVTNADTCERLHFLVPFDAERAQGWSDRAVMVILATKAGELLPRVTYNPKDWRCRMCSFSARCWGLPL
jgi:hypothetical protein